MKKRSYLPICGVVGVVVVGVVSVFTIGAFFVAANSSLPLSQYFSDTNSFENEQTLSFADIETVAINAKDIPVSIVESNIDEVTITSTAKNNGTGINMQPKVWIEDNTLYYDQGIILGIEPKSSGSVIVEIPKDLNLNYTISNGSGDVSLEVNTANDVNFDMAVGELNVYTSCKNLTLNSVSGDINIYGAINTITVDTTSSNVSLYANATTSEIGFESVSGNCKVFADELGGYNLYHKYAGGTIDDYFELSSNHSDTINITADTVDGKVEVFDKVMLDDINEFFKEDK